MWNVQRAFFEQSDIDAWRQGIVPRYVTSNAFIAGAYATVVLGFLRGGLAGRVSLEHKHPVYIMELGAGSGRFAFHFMRQFLGILRRSTLKDIPVKYVMTDFAERTLDFWQDHPSLKPFVEQGHLDFARFDAGHDRELTLCHSSDTLAPDSVKNPLVVLANYFFDSIPQDAFCIKDGRLCESLITVTTTSKEPDPADPEILKHIEVAYEHRPITGDYYDDPPCDRILRDYQQQLSDTAFTFPCAAIRCLRDLSALSSGRMLLLSADKGYSREEDLVGREEPTINVHGSFSMAVNYHAIGRYICNEGGQMLHTAHRHSSLSVCAFILGQLPDDTIETRQAYAAAIDRFGPDEFFILKKGLEKVTEALDLPEMLAFLRLSGWDAGVFLAFFPSSLDQVDSLSEAGRQELYAAIQQVWENYYPIGEERDLPFYLGMLLYGMTYYPEALDYFGHSQRLYGPNASSIYNMGMCHYGLRQVEDALSCVNEALKLDPAFEPAKGMRIKIQAEIARHGGPIAHALERGAARSESADDANAIETPSLRPEPARPKGKPTQSVSPPKAPSSAAGPQEVDMSSP